MGITWPSVFGDEIPLETIPWPVPFEVVDESRMRLFDLQPATGSCNH